MQMPDVTAMQRGLWKKLGDLMADGCLVGMHMKDVFSKIFDWITDPLWGESTSFSAQGISMQIYKKII